jgi:hypothetical protein
MPEYKNEMDEIKKMNQFYDLFEEMNLKRLNYDPQNKNMGVGDTELNAIVDFLEKSWE